MIACDRPEVLSNMSRSCPTSSPPEFGNPAPPVQALLGTAPIPPSDVKLLPAYFVIVWGAAELMRYVLGKRARREE